MRLSLRNKLLGAFLVVILVFAGASGFTFFSIGGINERSETVPHESNRVNQYNEIEINYYKMAYALRGFLLFDDPAYFNEYQESVEANRVLLQELIDTALRQHNREKFVTLMGIVDQYDRIADEKLIPLLEAGEVEAAGLLVREQLLPVGNELMGMIEGMITERQDGLITLAGQNITEGNKVRTWSTAGALFALVVGLLVALSISRQIVGALYELEVETARIAEGDLTTEEIRVRSGDEIGKLAGHFNVMLQQLRGLAISLREKSGHVAASAEQLSANAEETAAGAGEMASTMTDVVGGVDRVAGNVDQVQELSKNAAGFATEGQKGIERVTNQMASINSSSTGAAAVIKELNQTTQMITRIVETITDIADQTNLLALNAAIEAARAGEQGRGFAVVAEEVRKLAEQSAEAAKEIYTLINDVQSESEKAVAAVESGVEDVTEGVAVVHDVGRSFAGIMEAVENLNTQIRDVGAGVQQMAGAIHNVMATTEEQTAAMEEVASSTESLTQLAADLDEMSGRFKI